MSDDCGDDRGGNGDDHGDEGNDNNDNHGDDKVTISLKQCGNDGGERKVTINLKQLQLFSDKEEVN